LKIAGLFIIRVLKAGFILEAFSELGLSIFLLAFLNTWVFFL
jgi:hypothetical protein